MEKRFFFHKAGIVPLMILCCSVNAQTSRVNADLNPSSSKEVASNVDATENGLATFTNNPGMSTKAQKNFNKSFKEADNTAWFETGNTIKAEFTKDDVTTQVFYDRKGRRVASIRNYQEDKLPKDIRHRVRSHYYDYSIMYVQEITVDDKTAYLVKIEDTDSVKTIRVTDGEMDEYLAFEKAGKR